MQLWFDVESKYEATRSRSLSYVRWLWFDVESKYEATLLRSIKSAVLLWFDVESKYEATELLVDHLQGSCGLM